MEIIDNKSFKFILLKFIVGLLFATSFGVFFGFGVEVLKKAEIFLDFGGDKSTIIIALVFGIPLGSVFGFTIIDKVILKITKTNWRGILLGALFCGTLGPIISLALLDSIGSKALYFSPIIMVLLALGGYQITIRHN